MRVLVGFLLMASVLVANDALAQTNARGSIRGYVKDSQDAVLRGVRLTATSPDAPGALVGTSDDSGYYRLLDLPPGVYTISAELDGFVTWVREDVTIRAGLNLNVSIVMSLAVVEERVDVKAETPLVERHVAAQALNVSGEVQRALPLSTQSDWAAGLSLVPGMATGETSGGSQFFYLHGAYHGSHAIQIDGADATSEFQGSPLYTNFNTDWIQDVRITSAGSDASSPLGWGANIVIATRSGTDVLRGAGTFLYQNRSWNDSNQPGGTASAASIEQADLSLGGPVRRRRLWFFSAYRHNDVETGVSRTASQIDLLRTLIPGFQPHDNSNAANLSVIKLTAGLSSRHRLSGFYQYDRNPTTSYGVSNKGPQVQAFGGHLGSVELMSTWSSALTSRLASSYNDKSIQIEVADPSIPNGPVFSRTILSQGRLSGSGGQIANLGGGSTASQARPFSKFVISGDLTYYRAGLAGMHELRGGFKLEPSNREDVVFNYVNGGFAQESYVLRDPANPTAGVRPFYRQVFDAPSVQDTSQSARDFGFYAQDAWQPTTRLTLTGGARFDAVKRQDHIFGVTIEDSLQVAPRFGANYAVRGNGTGVLRGSVGRIYEVLPETRVSIGSNRLGFTDLYDLNGDGTFETVFTAPATTIASAAQVIDPGFHQPYANEFTLGYQQAFPLKTRLDVGYVFRQYRDRVGYIDINGIYDTQFRGYRDPSQNEIYRITNNTYNWNDVSSVDLTASVDAARLRLVASYSRQWRGVQGTWQPNDPASFLQPSAFDDDKGIGSNRGGSGDANSLNTTSMTQAYQWRDHMVRLGGIFTTVANIQAAVNVVVQTGPWNGPVQMVVAAADPRFGPPSLTLSNGRVVSNPLATLNRFVGPTRGDEQSTLPNYVQLNVRLSWGKRFRPLRLDVGGSGFNLTNSDADTQYLPGANLVYSPNYRLGSARQQPRSGQLFARVSF